MAMPVKSKMQIILYQKDDIELDGEWLTNYVQSTCFSKYVYQVLGRFKGAEISSAQGT